MRLRSLLLSAILALPFGHAGASGVARPVPPQPAEAVPMVLEVTLNGTRLRDLLNVQRGADGIFKASAGDLRHLRFKLDAALAPDALVQLDTLPGVSVRYDETSQTLELQAPDSLLAPHAVRLGGQGRLTDLSKIRPATAAILNYGLYHTHQSGRSHLAGSGELLLTGRAGVLSTTALYNERRSDFGYPNTVRLDSRWRYVDPVSVRSYTLGDFTSNALSWTSSVRLAGFQWASAFEQRSDIVTTALPQFSGSAALPSTLDLYINQQRIYSGEIPSGPFDLQSLPFVSGNEVTLVTTDATGRQITSTQAYYYSASLLREGLTQFSVDVGAPRFNYGLKSDDYDDSLFASGVIRYGLNNATTLEGHVEGSADGLVNLGAGLARSLGGRGVIQGAVSTSRYKGHSGTRVKLGLEGQLAGLRLYASTDRSFGDYFDLARVSNLRLARRSGVAGADYGIWLANTAQGSAVDRVGVGFTPFERASVNLNYNRIQYSGEDIRTASVSLSYGLTRRISLQANVYRDLDKDRRYGAFLALNIALDGVNASTSANRDNGRTRYTQQVSGIAGQRQGDIGWGLSNTFQEGGDDLRSAYVSYRAPQALLRARVDQYGSASRAELQAEGALVAAGGGVFASNRIGDAYAIITNAGPDVEVLQGGVGMGRTDRGGRALLPNLRPYYEQRVFIDPSTLPDGWEPEVTERIAAAGYRQGVVVDFGAKLVHGAVLVLHGEDGLPIPPGHVATLEGGGAGVVGYEGRLYLRGLNARNRVSVDLGPAGACSADFAYDAQGPAQPQIGPLVCQ